VSQNPRLSVVLATYNRANTLRSTLQHLSEQDLDPASFEVIVVDDGSPDHTREVVDEALRKVSFRLEYLHHPNQGPGYTQNRGLERANAPIVLLMADDILMSPQALSAHLMMHERNSAREVAVLGRVLQSPELNQSVFLRNWDAFRFVGFGEETELPYYRFWACNISAKRDFLLSSGGFREHRGRGGPSAHEDPEFGFRLHLSGLRILYCPEALGYHYHVVAFEDACRRKFEAGLNFGEFRSYAPEPEIAVAYHVLNRHTIGDHFRAWFSSRRRYLTGADRRPAMALARHLLRALAFNRGTVNLLWIPLIHRAEHDPRFARIVNREIYRGVLFYFFLSGNRAGDRKYGLLTSRSETRTGASA